MLATEPNRAPFANRANVLLLTVAGFSDSENVSTIGALRPTPVDPLPGVTLITVGAVVSGTAAVRNELFQYALALPARSSTPWICSETCASPGMGAAGAIVTWLPATA